MASETTDLQQRKRSRFKRLTRRIDQLSAGNDQLSMLLSRLDNSLAERLVRLEHHLVKVRDATLANSHRQPAAGQAHPVVPKFEESTPSVDPAAVAAITDEDVAFFRGNQIFGGLSKGILAKILTICKVRQLAANTTLFESGHLGDALHVVKSGVVEITRPDESTGQIKVAAYLGTGEVLCEVGVFTGAPHRSTARVPEKAEILSISWLQLTNLFREVPELALQMCTALATRLLEAMATLGDQRTQSRRLEGCLQYFDLAAVLQSLLASDTTTGVMSILDAERKQIGQIVIFNGQPQRAVCGPLRGEAAFHELMLQERHGGHFLFQEMNQDEPFADTSVEEGLIHRPKMSLLLDAARLRDEVAHIRQQYFTDLDTVWVRSAKKVPWREPSTKEVAQAVWRCLGQGLTVREILRQVPHAAHAVLTILATLVREDRISCPGQVTHRRAVPRDSVLEDPTPS